MAENELQHAELKGEDLENALMHFASIGMSDEDVDDVLMHYGVMGMKWGKHRAKATAKDIHKARRNLARQGMKYNEIEDKLTGDNKKDAPLKKQLAKMEKAFKDDPQRAIATRMTRGEKVAAVLLGGPLGLAVIGATSANSRAIERGQDKRAGRKS